MSMDLARKDFSTAPKYFIAGVDIGIAKATKTASEAVEAHAPVLIADGKVKPIAAPASAGTAVLTGLYGITADSADANKEVPVYLTGEFFADGLRETFPLDAEKLALRESCRRQATERVLIYTSAVPSHTVSAAPVMRSSLPGSTRMVSSPPRS